MTILLYCREGAVVAWHTDAQGVPASSYGGAVRVVPYDGDLNALPRHGPPEHQAAIARNTRLGTRDLRPFAQPEATSHVLGSFASQLAKEIGTQEAEAAEASCLADLSEPSPSLKTYEDVEARFADLRKK
jgi:hypothetical protein